MSLIALLGNANHGATSPPINPGGGGAAIPDPPAAPSEPVSYDYTISPGQNLASIAAGAPAGSSYLLLNGSHSFVDVIAKTGDQFWGESRSGTVIDGSAYGSGTSCFRGGNDNVTITRMTIRNFGAGTASTDQEQAAILCKAYKWAIGTTDQSFNWRIHDVTLHNNGNGGVYMGHHTIVTSSEIYNHGNTGIGGAYIAGGLIQGNIIRNNANNPTSGAGDNGAGIKLVNINQVGPHVPDMPPKATLSVIDNDMYNNYPTLGQGRPLWFDIDCHAIYAAHNRITENGGALFGIMWELCNDGLAEYNTVTGPIGYAGWAGSNFQNGALSASESHNIIFRDNTVSGANIGFMNRLSARGTFEGVGDNYVDTLVSRGELANSHAAITNKDQLSNIGCSNNASIRNSYINVGSFGDNYGSGHAGFSLGSTMNYTDNDISQSPGIVHYYDGVATTFPGSGRS